MELRLRELGLTDKRMQMLDQLGENFSGPCIFCTLHLLENKGGQFLWAIKHFEVVTLWVDKKIIVPFRLRTPKGAEFYAKEKHIIMALFERIIRVYKGLYSIRVVR